MHSLTLFPHSSNLSQKRTSNDKIYTLVVSLVAVVRLSIKRPLGPRPSIIPSECWQNGFRGYHPSINSSTPTLLHPEVRQGLRHKRHLRSCRLPISIHFLNSSFAVATFIPIAHLSLLIFLILWK